MPPSNKKKLKTTDFKISFVLNEEFEQFKSKAKTGQLYQAKIINKIDYNHYLLLLNKQKIIAEFPESLPIGEKIFVKVNNIARRISLQFLGSIDEGFNFFVKKFHLKVAFSQEEWHILFKKWIEYNLPLDDNSTKIYLQFLKYIKKIDQKLFRYIPEIWLLTKRWRLKLSETNILNLINVFLFSSEQLPFIYKELLNSQNKIQEQIYESVFSSLLFEKNMYNLKESEIKGLTKKFVSGSFELSSREELLSLIFKDEGFLLFPDCESNLRAIWIKKIPTDKKETHFHIISFVLMDLNPVIFEIYYSSDFIRILISASRKNYENIISKHIEELENKLADLYGNKYAVVTKNTEIPELILFKRLSETYLQIKRVI